MRSRSLVPVLVPAVLFAATLLGVAVLPLRGQDFGSRGGWGTPAPSYSPPAYYPPQRSCPSAPSYLPSGSCPAPVPPQVAPRPLPPTVPPTERPPTERPPAERTPEEQQRQQQQAQQQQEQQPSREGEQGLASAGESTALASSVLGDQIGLPPIIFLPQPHGRAPIPVAVPSVRSFKIAEDQSAQPQDRFYVDFNYFNNINRKVNETLGSPFHNIEAYRETFGVEKTFLDGCASLGLRIPLNTLTAESTTPGVGGTDNTDIGDLTIISKYAFWRDKETGSLLSAGLAVTTPTGPDHFANSGVFFPVHTTVLTPYLGFYFKQERWYTQGFTSIDVPVEDTDVTVVHNDVQVGYILHRNDCPDALLTAIMPNFEVHVSDPLNHRGAARINDPVGTPDWIDLTAGVTFELRKAATLAVGVVTPVTGPKPFDFEVLAQLNIRFGPSLNRGQQQQSGGAPESLR